MTHPGRDLGFLAGVVACLAMAAAAPLAAMVWSPILLGVPHVMADLRYLGGPSGLLPRSTWACLAAMVLHRLAGALDMPFSPRLELALGILAIGLSLGDRHGARRPGPLAVATLAAAAGLATAWPVVLVALLAHLHNLTAVWIWTRLGPATPSGTGIALVTYLGGLGLILSGFLDSATGPLLASPDGLALVSPLAPGLPSLWIGRLGLAFVYGQLVHYVIWLIMVPSSAPVRIGGAPFLVLGLGLLATLAVPCLALTWDPAQVRALYLGLAGFHAWLEWAWLFAGPHPRPERLP